MRISLKYVLQHIFRCKITKNSVVKIVPNSEFVAHKVEIAVKYCKLLHQFSRNGESFLLSPARLKNTAAVPWKETVAVLV